MMYEGNERTDFVDKGLVGRKRVTSPETSQKMELVTVTPEMAKSWLASAKGLNFRKLDTRRADMLARTISTQGWKLDGNPFKLNSKGVLIDGQHRAYAIAKLGIEVKTWVLHGIDDDVTIDTGTRRTLVQLLHARGERDTFPMGTALRCLAVYESTGRAAVPHIERMSFSNGELLDLLDANPGLRDSCKFCQKARGIISPGPLAMLHYVVSRAGQGAACDAFVDAVAHGAGLPEHSPAYLFRERMLKTRRESTPMPHYDRFALLIKAWNLYARGHSCRLLRWNPSEEFPDIETEAMPGATAVKEGTTP